MTINENSNFSMTQIPNFTHRMTSKKIPKRQRK